MSLDISSLRKLSVAEKLSIVTQLLDDIASTEEPFVVPPHVVAEAEIRSQELRASPTLAIDDDELWRRVDG